MGECAWFTMRVQTNGALEYRGIANVPRLGEHRGSVNFFSFDSIASVVETSGFLQLPSSDYSRGMSTGGETIITVEFNDGRSAIFMRAFANPAPLIWAVQVLMTHLLERAEWGDAAYAHAVEGPKQVDRSAQDVESRIDFLRRELPNSDLKRYLKTHLAIPPEPIGDDTWIVYRFDVYTTIRFVKESEACTLVEGEIQTTFANFAALADHLKANVAVWNL